MRLSHRIFITAVVIVLVSTAWRNIASFLDAKLMETLSVEELPAELAYYPGVWMAGMLGVLLGMSSIMILNN